MSKDKVAPDPFPHLPRRSFYDDTDKNSPPPIVPVKEQKIAGLKHVAAETVPKKRGRPKAEGQKPWEAEGVTQRTWYRRRKEKGAHHG